MQKRDALAVFMSFVLAVSLVRSPAFAYESSAVSPMLGNDASGMSENSKNGPMDESTTENVPSGEGVEGESIEDEQAAQEQDPEVADEDGEAEQDSPIEALEEGSTDEDSGVVRVPAADAIEFVYLDESVVAVGKDENIALGLFDEAAVIESARLDVKRLDTNEVVELDASAFADNAMLFTNAFMNESDAAGYQLVGVRYETGGVAYYADLTDVDGGQPYTFDVVTQSVANAVGESTEMSEDGEVSAYAIEDDGTLVAVEDVNAAVEIADPDGVNKVEAAESIVDGEMLEQGISGEEDAEIDGTTEGEPNDVREGLFNKIFGTSIAWADASSLAASREEYLIVALDPGHGGRDPGALANGLVEKSINLSIAQYCRDELNTYAGVRAIMTRSDDSYVGLQQRVDLAVAGGADVLVSIHCNSGGGTGAEVWVPSNSSYLNNETHVAGEELGNRILNHLTKLGLANRGAKVRPCTSGDRYPDGSLMDYYTVISSSRQAGIPGIIVEHAFVDNANDASKLTQESFRKQLGLADAAGIADKYSLVKEHVAQSQSLVKTTAHVANLGWLTGVYDCKVAGTTGKHLGLESFQVSLQNSVASSGGIEYRSYVGNDWQNWVRNGGTSGTTGKKTALQAVQIRLTGAAANIYDVYYRVHVANVGWLGWAKNGASAGSKDYNYNAEAVEVTLVPKGAEAPGDTTTPYKVKVESIQYQTHVEYIGWQETVSSGDVAGTTGRDLAIEAIEVSIANQKTEGSVQYNVHCANIGWQGWKENGAMGGTTGQSRQTEAIQIGLTGALANKYDIYYRVHSEIFGWLDWASNGRTAGTEGFGFSMQAIQVKLVEKGQAAPGATANPSRSALIGYQAHVSFVGWQNSVYDGATAGTTGESRAVEAIWVTLRNQVYSGGIRYRAHCANLGWQDWRSDGVVAGTTDQSRQMEAVKVELTGEMANKFDVYYRAHSQNFGWLGWAKNGESSGSQGYGYRMEAIQMLLVPKGGSAPGPTTNAFMQAEEKTPVMGASQATVADMVKAYSASGKEFPSWVYDKYGASNINQFCSILKQEADTEGVRAEVVFAQTMVETGWLQFGGDVKADQCNFAGLGAVGGGVSGNSFNDWGKNSVRKGLRAQVQHLKCYASYDQLNNPCVDPRWGEWLRGKAPYVEWLSIPNNPHGAGWASSPSYGTSLKAVLDTL